MVLGFLGKGGSGKSSVSTQMALWLSNAEKSVLAIDADHNMDLSFNLSEGNVPQINYLSRSMQALRLAVGLVDGQKYAEVFFNNPSTRFHLNPLSAEVAEYSAVLANGIRLMTAGPQTDEVLYGMDCSHALTTCLKLLLPLLELSDNEVVVVDEKAGADGVTTGIVSGIDVGVIVCEPSLHSIKTAKQIAGLMDFYETPYVFVANKVFSSEDKDFVIAHLGAEPITFLRANDSVKRNPSEVVSEWTDELSAIYNEASKLSQNNRLERTVRKFERNREFAHRH